MSQRIGKSSLSVFLPVFHVPSATTHHDMSAFDKDMVSRGSRQLLQRPALYMGRLRLPAGYVGPWHYKGAHVKDTTSWRLCPANAIPLLRGGRVRTTALICQPSE